MKIEKFKKYTTEEFILDNNFMNWVLHPNLENDRFWNEFLLGCPEKKQQIEEAVFLIKSLQVVESSVPGQKLDKIYINVKPHISGLRYITYVALRIAAIVLLVVSTAGLLYYFFSGDKLPYEIVNSELLEKGKVILPDGTVSEFDTERTEIQQIASGELTINNDTVIQSDQSKKSGKQAMTHVIIPYGKRSEITLVDGTKIWLNAGSQLSYPEDFSANVREVYLSGEAFFDVETDPARPFQVITNDMKIKVTGTRFNVTSYSNDQTTQAVLVSGKITAGKNKRFADMLELTPGERIVYDKQEGSVSKGHVDVELYSSWIDGYLIFEEEPLSEIFKKLERFYNKNILTEKLSCQTTFSGKLDLADDLEKVLKNIAFSVPFSVECENEVYLIKPKD